MPDPFRVAVADTSVYLVIVLKGGVGFPAIKTFA